MSDFVAGGAWVEVRPRFDRFEADMRAGLEAAFARVKAKVAEVEESIEDSFTEASNVAGQQLSLLDGSVFDEVESAAARAGERVEDAFSEASRTAEDDLQRLDDRGLWNRISSAAENAGDRIERHMRDASSRSRSHLGLIGLAVSGLGGLVASAGIGAAIAGSVGAAADLSESINAINVVLGEGADSFLAFGESAANNLGTSQAALNEAVTPMAALLKNAGLEGDELSQQLQDLATRATDTGSVLNKDVNEVLAAFGSAVRGELEPARALGVSFNDAAVQAKALELGLVDSNGEATEAGKVQARLALIMEQTAQNAGDFANTAGGLPNLMRRIRATGSELAATFGSALLPAIEGVGTGALTVLQGLGPQLGELGAALGRNLQPLFDSITPLLQRLIGPITSVVDVFGEAFGAIGPLIEPVATLLGGLVELGAGLAGTMIRSLAPAIERIAEILNGALAEILPEITELFEELGPTLGEIAALLAGAFADALPGIVEAFTQILDVLLPLLPLLTDGLLVVLQTLEPVLPLIVQGFVLWSAATRAFTIVQAALNVVLSANPISLIVLAIAGLVTGIVIAYQRSETFRGIVQGLWDVLRNVGTFIAGVFVETWDSLVTAFDAVVAAGATVIEFFQDLDDNIKSFINALPGIVLDGLAALGSALVAGLGAALDLFVGALETGLSLWLNYWVLLPVHVMAALVVLAPQVWAEVQRLLTRMAELISTGLTAVVNFFTQLPGRVATGLATLATTVTGKFTDMVNATTSTVSGWIDTTVTTVTGLPGKLAGALFDLGGRIGTAFTGAFNYVGGLVRGWVDSAASWLADLPSKMISGLSGLGTTLANFVKEKLEDAINAAIDLANNALPNSVGFGPASINVPDNPFPRVRLAQGDIIWRNTFAELAERNRPEVVVPMTRPGRALELLEASGMADLVRRNSGGDALHVEFSGGQVFQDATDVDAVAQQTYAAVVLRRSA